MSWLRGAFGSIGSRSKGSGATGTGFGRVTSYATALESSCARLHAENDLLRAEIAQLRAEIAQLRADIGHRDDFLYQIRGISQAYEEYLAGLSGEDGAE